MPLESKIEFLKIIVAVVPGTVAIGIAIWQQHIIDARNRLERHRRLAASRAVLPLTLSQIQNFEEDAIRKMQTWIASVFGDDDIRNGSEEAREKELPRLSDQSIEVLRSCIEDAEAPEGRSLPFLVQELQANQSRLHTFFNEQSRPHPSYPAENILRDFVKLYELTNNFYAYGRGESEKIDISVSSNALRSAAIFFEAPEIIDDLDADIPPLPDPPPFFRRR